MGTLGWDLPRHEDDAGTDPRKERGHLPEELAEDHEFLGESERLRKIRAYRLLLLELTRNPGTQPLATNPKSRHRAKRGGEKGGGREVSRWACPPCSRRVRQALAATPEASPTGR